MSQLNVDNIQNRTGSSGGPNFPSGISVAVGQTAYIHGNLQVDGTETIINTETLNVADKTVGIGSTSNASNTTADGAGIEVFASSSQTGNNKTLTWGNTSNSWEFGPNNVGLKVGTGVTINSSGVTVTGVVTATSFKGDGSLLTGIDATQIQNGNTSVQTVDTGSDGHVKMTTEGGERLRVGPAGQIGLGGANYGTSGQVLTSAGTGSAPTWSAIPAAGNTVDLVADGAIAAGKPVIIKSNGKAEECQEVIVPASPPVCGDTSGSRLYFGGDIKTNISSDYAANVTGFTATGLTFNCWRESDSHIRGRFTKYTNDNSHDSGFSTKTITSSGNAYDLPHRCRYVGDGYWLIIWSTGNSSSNRIKCRTIDYNGNLGVENTLTSQTNIGGYYFDAVRITDTRTVVTWRQNGSGSIYNHDGSSARVIDWSGSGTSRTISGGSDAATGIGNHAAGQKPSLAYDSTNSKVVLVCPSAGTSIKIVAGTVSGSAGSGSISWGTVLTFASGSDLGINATVTYDSTNDKLAAIYRRNSDGKIAGAVITIASNNTVTAYTKAFNGQTQTTDGDSTAVSSRGLFVRAYISNLAARIAGGTISGTTFTWQGNSVQMSNSDSALPQVNYISVKDRFELFREKTSGEELYSAQASASVSSTNVLDRNVIGFANAAISDGNTGTINIQGSVATGQSGLTPGQIYFVQNSGLLGSSVQSTQANLLAIASDKGLVQTRVAWT